METVLKVVKLKFSGHFPQTVAKDVIVKMKRRRMISLDRRIGGRDIITFLVAFDPEKHTLEGK